jgi:hypothetical protein
MLLNGPNLILDIEAVKRLLRDFVVPSQSRPDAELESPHVRAD